MYLTVRQQINHLSKEQYRTLKRLCRAGKDLTNQAIYNIRQHYFGENGYLQYVSNYHLLKDSPNYRMLNSNMAQQILKEVDGSFKSFFGLLKLAEKGRYPKKDCKLPGYLPKDGYTTLVIGFVRLNGNQLVIPYSNSFRKEHAPVSIAIPPKLVGEKIKEIRIIPRSHARFFEIQYTYEAKAIQREVEINKALALDPGVDNLVTAVTSEGQSFIIDGRRLKSINQWYNKRNARLQSIKDKQGYGKGRTCRQEALLRKRNNKVNDYMSKAARIIIGYCIDNKIGTLVAGYSETFQRGSNLGKRNNQTFANIPFGRLLNKLRYLCELNGIGMILQEESYTSKASFWDRDELPVSKDDINQEHKFSGQRIHRGQYRTADGRLLNADVNGALNILRKSSVVDLTVLYSRGDVDTPIRIRVA